MCSGLLGRKLLTRTGRADLFFELGPRLGRRILLAELLAPQHLILEFRLIPPGPGGFRATQAQRGNSATQERCCPERVPLLLPEGAH